MGRPATSGSPTWAREIGREIDFLPAESPGLENYGWDVFEGTHPFEDKEPNPRGRLIAPVAEYSHDEGCSITSGVRLPRKGHSERGRPLPLRRLLHRSGCGLSPRAEMASQSRGACRSSSPGLGSFGEDAAGELYLLSLEGDVYELDPR